MEFNTIFIADEVKIDSNSFHFCWINVDNVQKTISIKLCKPNSTHQRIYIPTSFLVSSACRATEYISDTGRLVSKNSFVEIVDQDINGGDKLVSQGQKLSLVGESKPNVESATRQISFSLYEIERYNDLIKQPKPIDVKVTSEDANGKEVTIQHIKKSPEENLITYKNEIKRHEEKLSALLKKYQKEAHKDSFVELNCNSKSDITIHLNGDKTDPYTLSFTTK